LVDGVAMQNYVIRISDDEGASWREHPFGPTDGWFGLEGVDPSNPDRLIAIVHRPERPGETLEQALDQALVSTDQGETFEHYLVLTQSSNVVFAPDGRVWIGDLGSTRHTKATQGLWFAPDLATTAAQLAEFPVACLAHQPDSDALLTCQRWWFGTVDLAAGTFSASMRFQEVDELVQCPGADHTASCQQQLCRSYCHLEHFAQAPACAVYAEICDGDVIVAPTADAGPATSGDAGAGTGGSAGSEVQRDAGPDAGDGDDAGRGDSAKRESGCACGAAGVPGRGAAVGGAFGGALIVLARRVRRRAH
jgi:hypothetical protein